MTITQKTKAVCFLLTLVIQQCLGSTLMPINKGHSFQTPIPRHYDRPLERDIMHTRNQNVENIDSEQKQQNKILSVHSFPGKHRASLYPLEKSDAYRRVPSESLFLSPKPTQVYEIFRQKDTMMEYSNSPLQNPTSQCHNSPLNGVSLKGRESRFQTPQKRQCIANDESLLSPSVLRI